MIHRCFTFTLILTVLSHSHAKVGFGPGVQDWGNVSVRPNATMFWWLYYTTADVKSFYEKPLVVWLQGGPGGSSTGYGNFELIGPLDLNLKPREHNWVKKYNVLFIDSPVGTGFSHADHDQAFATTNKQAAADLLKCIKEVFEKDPNLKKVRSYIVGESYGGKIGIEFARVWYEAEKSGKIESKIKGIAMGDAWISPIDSVMSWAPYLLHTGMIDDRGYKLIETYANATKAAVENGNWRKATRLWGQTESIIDRQTQSVDFYNILTKIRYHGGPEGDKSESDIILESLMNSKVKSKLNLTTVWGEQSSSVFSTHAGEFMKPVIDQVEYVLNNTDLNVFVYNGQLDLIVDTPGTIHWVNSLRWPHREKWHSLTRKPLLVDNIVEGYVKKFKKFAMYWINRSGHMGPKDNPVAILEMMNNFTLESNSKNNTKH